LQANSQNKELSCIDSIRDTFTYTHDTIESNPHELKVGGTLYRRSFIFFKKKIGTFNAIVYHRDTMISLISKTKNYIKGDKSIKENYSFHNNNLIKYTQLAYTGIDSIHLKQIQKQYINKDQVVYKSLMTIHGETELETKSRLDKIINDFASEFREYINYIDLVELEVNY